jgi:phage I-like protein
MLKSLIACSYLFALSQTTDDNKLNEIKLAVIGKWKGHPSGPFEITLEIIEQIKTNFDNSDVDVVVDFEHASLWNEKAPATGWVKELFIKDDELWAKVKWIGESSELIKSEQYKYISPVFNERTIDQVTGDDIGWSLHSVALTNRPFLEELGEVIANNKQPNKGDDMGMTPEEQKRVDNLEQENKDLKATAATAEDKRVEDEVDGAIAATKVHPDQKDSLLAFGKANPEGLTKLLESAKTIVVKPGDNLYANSQQNNNAPKYDVLKLGGIE